jgi:coenzyme F420-0:L-glutamate ligase/coenzyme F420-1:gamma-L-glutamate ligase
MDSPTTLQAIPLKGWPILDGKKPSPSFSELLDAWKKSSYSIPIQEGDIIAISHTFLAKIYGFYRSLSTIKVSQLARALEPICKKDPRMIQMILDESRDVLRIGEVIITENQMGIIGANSGIDKSNIADPDTYIFLPSTLPMIAEQIGKIIMDKYGFAIPIIITDSLGKPFRLGATGIAVTTWGLTAFMDLRGQKDLFGYEMQHSELAIGDSLATLADLVMGQTDEGVPIVLIRGWKNEEKKQNNKFNSLQRPKNKDLFRKRDWSNIDEAVQDQLLLFLQRKSDV